MSTTETNRRSAHTGPLRDTVLQPASSESRTVRRALLATGFYAALAGAASFLGWALNVPRLADWHDNGISIQPNAAIAAIAAGIALALSARRQLRTTTALGVFVTAIGAATLVEHVSGADLRIDTLLMFDRPWGRGGTVLPGRMGPPAAVSWTLIGMALILSRAGPIARRIAATFGVIVVSIAALSLTGYLFGADRLYTIPTLTVVAAQTAWMIIACGLGILLTVPEQQPMRLLLEHSAAGVFVRRLLPLVIVIPTVLGFLRVAGQNAGLYDTATGTAMLNLILIALLCTVLWWAAKTVREYEAKLVTSVRELEAVFRAAPVGIAIARDSQCTHVDINGALGQLLGLREGENASLTGAGAGELPFRVTDENGRAVEPRDLPLQVAARTGEPVSCTLVVRREQTTHVSSGSAVAVEQAGSSERGAIAVFIDVTAERRAAEEREQLLAVAQRARLEAETANRVKDEFLAVLSHELRSPLNAMLGWLQIMRRRGADAGLMARAIDTLERNTRAQTQIISDLLDISRIQSGKLELERARLDLAATVAASVEALRPMAEARALQLDLSMPAEPLLVDGDAVRLQQAVTNVVHNAIKFTPEGGRIAVTMVSHDGQHHVRIADSGQGIDQALLPHIFDRFFQAEPATTRRHGGLGLGLAIVKQLVERHGGTVHAHTDGPGQGAVFTLTLPAAAHRHEELPVATLRPITTDGSIDALDVLVVEDGDDSREALRLSLEQAGACVRVARSVREALAAYDQRPPDVLVSDIGMPDEDGYSLIRAIRDREDGSSRRTLALAITGFASTLDHEAALRAGFDDHLGKPVDPAALVQRLRSSELRRETAPRSLIE